MGSPYFDKWLFTLSTRGEEILGSERRGLSATSFWPVEEDPLRCGNPSSSKFRMKCSCPTGQSIHFPQPQLHDHEHRIPTAQRRRPPCNWRKYLSGGSCPKELETRTRLDNEKLLIRRQRRFIPRMNQPSFLLCTLRVTLGG